MKTWRQWVLVFWILNPRFFVISRAQWLLTGSVGDGLDRGLIEATIDTLGPGPSLSSLGQKVAPLRQRGGDWVQLIPMQPRPVLSGESKRARSPCALYLFVA